MKRIALLILLFAAACTGTQLPATPTPAPAPTVTSTPKPTEVPETVTATPTATGPVELENFVEMSKVVDNWEFANEYFKQNAGKDSAFSTENGRLYLNVGGSTVEVDQKSAGVNVDINGKALTVEGTGFDNIISIHGVGENADKVYAYAPETTITLDEKGTTKTFEGGWFEVIKPNHPVDMDAPKAELERELLEAINDPVTVTLEQVQSGEWAESVLLSGLARPIPDDVEFTGNALYHGEVSTNGFGRITLLYTSYKPFIPFFARVVDKAADGSAIQYDLRSYTLWNPKDLKNPDRNQIAVVGVGFSPDRADKYYNEQFVKSYILTGAEPMLIVSAPDVGKDGHSTLEFISNPSVLQNLPGNDAMVMFQADIGTRIDDGREMFQTVPFYLDPEEGYKQVETVIWLAYFINKAQ